MRSPGGHTWPALFWSVGTRTKRGVSDMQSRYQDYMTVKLFCGVSTSDVNLQKSNGLVIENSAETWHAYQPFLLPFEAFSCFARLCSTTMRVSKSTIITWSSCSREHVICIGCDITDINLKINLDFQVIMTLGIATELNKINYSRTYSFDILIKTTWGMFLFHCVYNVHVYW